MREEVVSQAESTFLRCKPKETLHELWQRTKTIARLAYRNHHLETEQLMACNGFVNALNDRLKEKRHLSIDEALEHATQKVEIATAVSRSASRPVRLFKKDSPDHSFKRRRWKSSGRDRKSHRRSLTPDKDKEIRELKRQLAALNAQVSAKKRGKCFRCGEVGHLARECGQGSPRRSSSPHQ